MKTSKAILISTDTKTVSEITVSSLEDIYNAIGNGCNTFCCPISLDKGDTIYADDEGLFHPYKGAVVFNNYHSPLVGNLVVLGTDWKGQTIDVQTSIADLIKQFQFIDLNNTSLMDYLKGFSTMEKRGGDIL